MVDIGSNAMEELIRLVQMDEPLWIKSCTGDSISLDSYRTLFPDRGLKNSVEASRDSGIVFLDPLSLVDLLVDSNKCLDMFPTIISKARTLQVLATGNGGGGRNGTLLLVNLHFNTLYLFYFILFTLTPLYFYFFYYYADVRGAASSITGGANPGVLLPPVRSTNGGRSLVNLRRIR